MQNDVWIMQAVIIVIFVMLWIGRGVDIRKKHLPALMHTVITWNGEYVHFGYIDSDNVWVFPSGRPTINQITHWMPLPEPPKEEETISKMERLEDGQ